jgi:hypothetical protein
MKKNRRGGGSSAQGTFDSVVKKVKKFWSKTKFVAILVVFAGLSLASLAGLYSAYSTAVEEEKITPLVTYRHFGGYDYVAGLKPNEIYDNRSTTGPGENLYIKIVENLSITFRYRFSCNRPAAILTEYRVDMEVESPGKWVKTFKAIIENSVSSQENAAEFSTELFVSVPWFEGLKSTIDTETGTSSSSYNLRIKPNIHTRAEYGMDVRPLDESFTPELVLNFNYGGAAGSQIVVSGLESNSSGSIPKVEKVYHPEVPTQRRAFGALSLVALAGLICSLWLFLRARPEKPEKAVEEMISPFKEAMVEVAGEPEYREQRATVRMKSLEDLVYIAEGLAKPVLHLREERVHTFYVLDGPVRYEYSFKLPKG